MITIAIIITLVVFIIIWEIWIAYGRVQLRYFLPLKISLISILTLVILLIGSLPIIRPSEDKKSSYSTLIIDLSPSLVSEEDGKPRYQELQQKAKSYARSFFDQCNKTQSICDINIIIYAGRAFELKSYIKNYEEADQLISTLHPDLIRRDKKDYDGSNLSDALLLAEGLRELRGRDAASTSLAVFTDGNNNVGLPLDAVSPYIKSPGQVEFIGKDLSPFTQNNHIIRSKAGSIVLLPHEKHLYISLIQKLIANEIDQKLSDKGGVFIGYIWVYTLILGVMLTLLIIAKISEISMYKVEGYPGLIVVYGMLFVSTLLILSEARISMSSNIQSTSDHEIIEITESNDTSLYAKVFDDIKTLQKKDSPTTLTLLYTDDGGYIQKLFEGDSHSLDTIKLADLLDYPLNGGKTTNISSGNNKISILGGNRLMIIFAIMMLLIPTPMICRICRI